MSLGLILQRPVLEMVALSRIMHVARTEGVASLAARAIRKTYQRGLRPLSPSVGPVHFAGIPTSYKRKWLDQLVPQFLTPREGIDQPGYESALVDGLKLHVRPSDKVVIVGGGIGVTAAIAALCATHGRVDCFEGSESSVGEIQATLVHNGVQDRTFVHHAVVGAAISVWGKIPTDSMLQPSDLPECDVLELDCEGAELVILQGMKIRPRVCLVETHGLFGAPTDTVKAILGSLGYSVEDLGVAEPTVAEYCEDHDIRVLCATKAV